MQPHVSASQISTFRRCPRRWYYAKVAKVEVPNEASPHTARGSAVHYALEHYALSGELPTSSVPRYLSTAEPWPKERTWNGKVYANPTVNELAAQAVTIADALLTFAERLDKDCIEAHFRLPTAPGLPDVLGYVDVYEPDKALVTDWKVRSNHRRNALRADNDTCHTCGYLVLGCQCPDPQRLSDDVQMNIYARRLLTQRPELDAATVRHIYASSSGAPAPFGVRQSITRSANALFWDRIVALVGAMDRVSRMAETDIPRIVDACNDYGGCAYRAVCYQQPFGGILEEPVTREEVLAEMMNGTGHPVNPPLDPFLAIHEMSTPALDALCDAFRQPMGIDLRKREPAIQIPAVLAYLRQWPFDSFAKGWYARVNSLFPAVTPPPPSLPDTAVTTDLPDMGAQRAVPQEKSYRATLTDFLKGAGLKALRAIIVADRQEILSPLYRDIRNKCLANVKPPVGQTELFAAFKEEYELRKIPVSMFAGIFNRHTTPAVDNFVWVPTFLLFSPDASRPKPETADPVQFEWLCQKGALAEHPQGGAWYVTEAFRKEWEKHHTARAAEHVRATQPIDNLPFDPKDEAELRAQGVMTQIPDPPFAEPAKDFVTMAVESGGLTAADFGADDAPPVPHPVVGSRADLPNVQGIITSIQGLLEQLARALA